MCPLAPFIIFCKVGLGQFSPTAVWFLAIFMASGMVWVATESFAKIMSRKLQ